ncbi:MAG TPA: zinc ABC transporter substrate-binding protein, partial [Deinococcales bacterium]|nr:zinc ABC transporter substrate-binding protein [Deinococcales bacterium]
SERAFQYMADDYGVTEGYLWEIDTDEQGTPQQISSLISFVREAQPAGLLVETNVDARPMETVSRETGVPIVGEIYSDELGPEGSPGETYVSYLDYNLQMLMKAMRPD